MALDLLNQDDENKKQQQGAAPAAPAAAPSPPTAGAAPAQPGSGMNTSGQGPAQAQGKQRTGSGFVNLQNIISANRQNKLGSTINQGMQGVAGNVRQNLNQNQQLFNQEMDKNRLGTEKDVQDRDTIINRITGYQAPQQPQAPQVQVNTAGQGPNAQSNSSDMVSTMPVSPALQDPAAVPQAPTPPVIDDLVGQDEVNTFQKFRGGQYQGPQSLRDYDMLQEQAQQAEGLGQNISSTGGRQSLLQQFVGRDGNYSRGKQALDSLILGQTGAQDLRAARKATFGLGNQVGGAENLAGQQAAVAAGIADKFGQETRNKLGGKQGGLIGDIYGSIEKDTAARNLQAGKDFKDFQDRLAKKQLGVDDLDEIESLVGTGEGALFGLNEGDLSKAFNQTKFNLEDLTDNTELAKINALQKLAGISDIKLDASKLGAQKNSFTTDGSQFSSYRDKQDKYSKDLQDYKELLGQSEAEEAKYNTFKNALSSKFTELDKKQYDADGEGGISQAGQSARAKDMYDTLMAAANDSSIAATPEIRQRLIDHANKLQYTETDGDTGQSQTRYRTYTDDGESRVDNSLSAHSDFATMFNPSLKNTSADVKALNQIIKGINDEQNKGGSRITDLMSPEAKAAYEARTKKQAGAYDQELRDKLLGKAGGSYRSAGSSKTLVDLLGGKEGINRMLVSGGASALIGTPLSHEIGSFLGSGVGDLFRGAGQFGGSLGNAIGSIFSDENLKTDIKSGDKDVERFLNTLSPYSYDYKNQEHGKGRQLGVMAQDLEKTSAGKQAVEDTPEGKAVNYGKLAGMMMASQANLHKRLKELETKKKK